MKKILAILLTAIMLFTMFGTAFAASDVALTYHITCGEDHSIKVPTGKVIIVSFSMKNTNGAAFSLESFQNEIYFDHDFFTYIGGSATAVKNEGLYNCGLKVSSDLEHRVYVNSIQDTAYEAEQLVATFMLQVKETRVGASSVIETKLPMAAAADGDITVSEENLTVIIDETDSTIKYYDISYYDGETLLDSYENILGGEKIMLAPAPAKEGYNFAGWKIGSEILPAGSDYTVTSDVTAHAVWKAKQSYVLSFDTDGGSFVEPVTAYEGDTVTLNQTSAKSGYTFDGWWADSALTTPVTSVLMNGNTTVYAKWNRESSGGGGGASFIRKNTITFKNPDGIVLGKEEKVYNTTVDLTVHTYDKEGYTLEGWYTDKELTDKVLSVTVSQDITLYANWVEDETGASSRPNYHPDILTTEHYAYIVGREGGYICPQDNITRAEVATIFFRLLTEEIRIANMTDANDFQDVAEDAWYNRAISTLTALEILKGRTEDSFAPDAFITRAEFTTIAARFSDVVYDGEDLFSDISGHWAQDYINAAASIGWIVGENGRFRPDDNITRAEVMTLVNRVLNRLPESTEDLLEDMTIWADNADPDAWYYLAVQEATNSHTYEMNANGIHEVWIALTKTPDWTALEK